MGILIMVGQMLLALSILIVLHELGHFLAARAFGVRVEKFYLFFDAWGVKLVKFNYKGCEYGIGWLPLGGYVKISGMIDESMDTEQLKQPAQPWEFRSKPAWQRLIIMLGGIIVNIILGVFIFWMLTFKYGETYTVNEKLTNGIVPGKVGEVIGLKPGDKVVAINGTKVEHFEDLISSKVLLGNSNLTIDRSGQQQTLKVPGDILEEISDYGIGEFIQPRFTYAVDSVMKDSPAAKAGLKKGDRIVAVNDSQTVFFDQLQAQLATHKSKPVTLTIKREGRLQSFSAVVDTSGRLGFIPKMDELPREKVEYGFFASLPKGASKAWGTFADNAKGLGKVATGQVKATKAFQGPIGIAGLFGRQVDWVKFWTLTGLLSMALALMNLLPIPALDGGHAMFLIIEMIKKKPLSDKFMERAQIVGFVILIALMVFIFGNDIFRLATK